MTTTPIAAPSLREILRRVHKQILLFAFVLAALLLLSSILIIPRFGRIEIGGTIHSITELAERRSSLIADLTALRDRRDATLLPLRNSPYGELVAEKVSAPNFADLRESIRNIARNIVPEVPASVDIAMMKFDASGMTIELQGRIEHVGPRSMTILAEFIEELRKIPGLSEVRGVHFTREEDATGAFFSPFDLTLFFTSEAS